jgi:hypothetical protein
MRFFTVAGTSRCACEYEHDGFERHPDRGSITMEPARGRTHPLKTLLTLGTPSLFIPRKNWHNERLQ